MARDKIRNPKAEIRKKSQAPNPKDDDLRTFTKRHEPEGLGKISDEIQQGGKVVLTIQDIVNAPSDQVLFEKLTAALTRGLPPELHNDLDKFVEKLKDLPPGLRAMASTFQLDVSMCLDDLGWHFANWHHHPYCQETSQGLRVLGAIEVADLFDRAYQMVLPYWDAISKLLAKDFKEFVRWYNISDLEKSLDPLNKRLWDILKERGEFSLMKFWLDYARKFPERVADHAG
jgi:hypothetical protein